LVDRTAVALRVQICWQKSVRGFGSGCSDEGSQFEHVLSPGFSILFLD
jgi:hypothetical protein